MAGLLTKDILFYLGTATYTASTDSWAFSNYTEVANFYECPSLGGTPEKVEVTCLKDGSKKYINGLKDYGDLAFKFYYDNSATTSNFRVLKAAEAAGVAKAIKIEYPDGTKFEMAAEIAVSTDAAATNNPITFTCNAALQSDITITNPTLPE